VRQEGKVNTLALSTARSTAVIARGCSAGGCSSWAHRRLVGCSSHLIAVLEGLSVKSIATTRPAYGWLKRTQFNRCCHRRSAPPPRNLVIASETTSLSRGGDSGAAVQMRQILPRQSQVMLAPWPTNAVFASLPVLLIPTNPSPTACYLSISELNWLHSAPLRGATNAAASAVSLDLHPKDPRGRLENGDSVRGFAAASEWRAVRGMIVSPSPKQRNQIPNW
jgi:hypothetical protein